jgi:hypothetical protein
MKVAIKDAETLNAIRPLDLAAYLRSTGWRRHKVVEDRWSVWIKGDDFEVALPLNRDFHDFTLRMSDALATIEVVEERSQIEILSDLLTSSSDVLRFRLESEFKDGTISIDEGVRVVQKVRDLLMAGACAAINPQAVYPTRKPGQAVDYLKKVRMGQTERGSYVITAISRVPPELRLEEGENLFEIQEPFERRVTITIAEASLALKRAAEQTYASSDFKAFQAAVPKGVSANLCDAIRGLSGNETAAQSVEIGFSWSRGRPINREIPKRIVFQPDVVSVIEEAGRVFRESSPREDYELRGPVIKLERPEGSDTGRVTVMGFVDDRPRKIAMVLNSPDYDKAVEAHRNQQSVFCYGELTREGRAFTLVAPRGFIIEPEE